jgi:hypothetical protein
MIGQCVRIVNHDIYNGKIGTITEKISDMTVTELLQDITSQLAVDYMKFEKLLTEHPFQFVSVRQLAELKESDLSGIMPVGNAKYIISTAKEVLFSLPYFTITLQSGQEVYLTPHYLKSCTDFFKSSHIPNIEIKDCDVKPYGGSIPGELFHAANRNPRSALVTTTDNQVYFVSTPGRKENDTGMTLPEFAYYLSKIPNVKDAINLDGGASSRITLKTSDNSITYLPSSIGGIPYHVGTILSFVKYGDSPNPIIPSSAPYQVHFKGKKSRTRVGKKSRTRGKKSITRVGKKSRNKRGKKSCYKKKRY